jgi:fatty-acyl-CoA synthase
VGLAVVVAAPEAPADPDALRTALLAVLAPFKVPRHIRFADALPKTATGKIRKADLRTAYAPTDGTGPDARQGPGGSPRP